MQYRREVDGLRAVAVLSAIFFHAGFATFGGGYVGVDVFFVVSGYLITSIILAEHKAGTFSLTSFYERRARRILPALFVVMLACLPFAWAWSLPSEVRSFSDSLVAVTMFSSNILFWLTSGYFEHDAELRPMLHTWSLAVEEQYYVFFPLFLLFMWRFRKRWTLIVLVIVAALSLLLAQKMTFASPSTSYYLLPTRGWELLVGVFVALYFFDNPAPHFGRFTSEIGGVVGLALIAYAIFAFDRTTPFPSYYTLAPTVGTALILLFSGPGTLVGRLLGNRVFVGIGLISYSAYLWHQPMFAFARQWLGRDPSKLALLGLAAIAMVAAYFSWKYIETPFRNKQKFSRRQIFIYSLVGAIFFVAVGIEGHQLRIKTLWQMEHPHLVTFSQPSMKAPARDCPNPPQKLRFSFCKITGSGPKRVVLWGDSHAGALAEDAPAIPGAELYSIWHYGCPPVAGVRRFDHGADSVDCNRLSILDGYAHYVAALKPDVVILDARWSLYLEGWQRQGVLQVAHKLLTDSDTDATIRPIAQRKALLRSHLLQTIEMFSQHARVILLTQVPDYGPTGFHRLEVSNFSLPIEDMLAWHKDEMDVMDSLKGTPNLTVVDMKRLFCSDVSCVTRKNGVLLYADDDHLSPRGADLSWPLIVGTVGQELTTGNVAQQ